MNNPHNKIRSYTIEAGSFDRGVWCTGTFTIRAYNREEALAQFKERRWELVGQPPSFKPLGRDCESITCSPAEEEVTDEN